MASPRRYASVAVLVGLVCASPACLSFEAYSCETPEDCRRGDDRGSCEPTHACSFTDPTCESERRYERLAGHGLGGQCVPPDSADATSTGESTSEGEVETTTDAASTHADPSSSESASLPTCGGPDEPCCENDTCRPSETQSQDLLACLDGVCGCVVDLAAGPTHTCLQKVDGSIACWGANDRGQLAGSPAAFEPRPVSIPKIVGTQSLALAHHGCAVVEEGRVLCWGSNTSGQAVPTVADPVVLEPLETVLGGPAGRVATGEAFTCAARTGGVVMTCFGNNDAGQLATDALAPGPADVLGELEWAELELGAAHGCGRTVTGEMYCWGDNTYGQLGSDPLVLPGSAALVGIALPPVGDLAVGRHHTCARTNTTVHCFGRNDEGQLGNGTQTSSFDPNTAVTLPKDIVITALVSGPNHTCVLGDDTVACWGSNAGGQLMLEPDATGNDAFTVNPVPLDTGGLSIARLVGGNTHACALTRRGEVYCWGSNDRGQIGDGTSRYAFAPTRVDAECR